MFPSIFIYKSYMASTSYNIKPIIDKSPPPPPPPNPFLLLLNK